MSQKYLYGASVQGIQDYIFKTNALKEIIGGTEIVQRICTDLFEGVLKKTGGSFNDENCIVRAAGNVRYIFDSKEDCQKVFRVFPKAVLEEAPGVTISQAAVPYDDNYAACSQKLEEKLHAQRNRPMRSTQLGLMGIKRNPRTGMPALAEEGGPDEGIKQKLAYSNARSLCEKAFGKDVEADHFPFNLGDLTGQNDWIAVIHADGNGMGRRFQEAGRSGIKDLKSLSQSIDKKTSEAAQAAYEIIAGKYKFSDLPTIPIRPIVLSGDDFSVICRADLALDYVCEFIKAFEQKTKTLTEDQSGFSACAGIAFVKSSFPFYFSYALAESLCDEAKKEAREINKSCVLFHKVQDSFYSDFKDIKERELSPRPPQPRAACQNENVAPDDSRYSLCFGPYYIKLWTQQELKDALNNISDRNEQNTVRNWLSSLSVNPARNSWTVTDLMGVTNNISDRNEQNTVRKWLVGLCFHSEGDSWLVDGLKLAVDMVNDKNNLKNIVRKWLSGVSVNPDQAVQWVKRARAVNSRDEKLCEWIDRLTRMDPGPSPAYDVLSLNTVIHQTTKK